MGIVTLIHALGMILIWFAPETKGQTIAGVAGGSLTRPTMNYSRPWMYGGLMLMVTGAVMLWHQGRQPTAQAEPPKTTALSAAPSAWKSLFDGKTLDGWKVPQFGGEGKVYVKDGQIVMEMGSMMTGIAWTGDVIRDNYELELEGMRLDGSDFFCTTTFPVGKEPCSLVVGGWGGALVGLSSIDGADASENPTMQTMAFKNGKWYPIRIRVSDAAVQAWIDGERMVNQPRKDHKFSIRMEVEQCRPLGISTYATKGAVRNIRVRPLKPDEIQATQEEATHAEEY